MSQETSGFSQHQPRSQSISFPIHGPPKPTPAHLIPNRSPHTYWVFFFNELSTVQGLMPPAASSRAFWGFVVSGPHLGGI